MAQVIIIAGGLEIRDAQGHTSRLSWRTIAMPRRGGLGLDVSEGCRREGHA